MATAAERQRNYRQRHGARPGPRPTAPCGTPAAYKRHKRNGEIVDDACREAYNTWHRNYHRDRSK